LTNNKRDAHLCYWPPPPPLTRAQPPAPQAELAAANAARQAEAVHEDHDSRPLRKAERLRLASSNKEEGTALFKDGNLAPAVARWSRALEHTTKFIDDVTPEDRVEIDALRLSLHLNIAMALLRMGGEASLRRAVESTTAALAIDAANAKALYRRASAQHSLKQYAAAKADLAAAEAAEPGDKAVAALAKAVEAAIAVEKSREKAVYSKMFS
jgi:peptidyl-prolyl isomerase D